ncbi:MAG: hypothetical protein H5T78_11130 [Nocardia sp.]|nr:hypothetical protein [Nocardia sp.]
MASEAAAIGCGAVKAQFQPAPDRWRVLLDPSGHPFCLTVPPGSEQARPAPCPAGRRWSLSPVLSDVLTCREASKRVDRTNSEQFEVDAVLRFVLARTMSLDDLHKDVE